MLTKNMNYKAKQSTEMQVSRRHDGFYEVTYGTSVREEDVSSIKRNIELMAQAAMAPVVVVMGKYKEVFDPRGKSGGIWMELSREKDVTILASLEKRQEELKNIGLTPG
jgi:hypothetical protein